MIANRSIMAPLEAYCALNTSAPTATSSSATAATVIASAAGFASAAAATEISAGVLIILVRLWRLLHKRRRIWTRIVRWLRNHRSRRNWRRRMRQIHDRSHYLLHHRSMSE